MGRLVDFPLTFHFHTHVLRTEPKESILALLRKLLAVREAVRHCDVLKTSIMDPGTTTEDLVVQATLPLHGAVHCIGIVGVQPPGSLMFLSKGGSRLVKRKCLVKQLVL